MLFFEIDPLLEMDGALFSVNVGTELLVVNPVFFSPAEVSSYNVLVLRAYKISSIIPSTPLVPLEEAVITFLALISATSLLSFNSTLVSFVVSLLSPSCVVSVLSPLLWRSLFSVCVFPFSVPSILCNNSESPAIFSVRSGELERGVGIGVGVRAFTSRWISKVGVEEGECEGKKLCSEIESKEEAAELLRELVAPSGFLGASPSMESSGDSCSAFS